MAIKFDPKTGSWMVTFSKRHPATRQPKSLRRIGLKSKSEAKRVERELIITIENSFKEDTGLKWPELAKMYMDDKRLSDWTEKTYENCKICLEAHTFADWKDRFIDSISPHEIKELIIQKVGTRSTSHQKTLLKFIRGTFQFAVDKRILKSNNPTPRLSFQVGDKIKKVLTEQQVRVFLNKAKELDWEWYPHWMLALYLGMRNGELYALTWDKVNFDTKQILVNLSWNNKDGEKCTKSGDDRIVPINEGELLPFLKKLKLENADSHYVLPRISKWDKGEQARELRLFLRSIGLPELRFHDLRATWATLLLSKGVPAVKVMSMGGWSDYKTLVIYLRKAGIGLEGATDILKLESSNDVGKVLKFGLSSDA